MCDMRTTIEECDEPVINFVRDIQGSKFLREGVMTNRIKCLCKVQREQRDIGVGGLSADHRCTTVLGSRAFHASAPKEWNRLPLSLSCSLNAPNLRIYYNLSMFK